MFIHVNIVCREYRPDANKGWLKWQPMLINKWDFRKTILILTHVLWKYSNWNANDDEKTNITRYKWYLVLYIRKPVWKIKGSFDFKGSGKLSCFLMLRKYQIFLFGLLYFWIRLRVIMQIKRLQKCAYQRVYMFSVSPLIICRFIGEKAYLKCTTDILDSCWSNPHTVAGIKECAFWIFIDELKGKSFTWSLTYAPAQTEPSNFASSISLALANTFFWVLWNLSKENILAYSRGSDS